MAQATENTSKKRGSAKVETSNAKVIRSLASGDTYTLLLIDMLGEKLEAVRALFADTPNMLDKVMHGILWGFDRKVANFTAESKELEAAKVIELRLGEWKRLCNPNEKWIAEDKDSKASVAKAEKEAIKASLEAEKAKNNKLIDLVVEMASCTDEARKAELLAEIASLKS